MARKANAKPTREQAVAAAEQHALQVTALAEVLGSGRRLMWVNFLAGLARGVGFFLGATLVGGLLIGVMAILFDMAASTLGFKDLSLKDAVRAVVVKFEEIRQEVDKVQAELKAQRESAPPPEAPVPVEPEDG